MVRSSLSRSVLLPVVAAAALGSLVTPGSALAVSAAAAIRHDFAFRVNPLNQFRVDALMRGQAYVSNRAFDSYFDVYSQQGAFGITDADNESASVARPCTSASANSSWAYGSLNAPVPQFVGSLYADASASAVQGCGRVSAASEAVTAMSVREGRANRAGRINWKPRFNTAVGAAAWGFVRDPVVIDFLDPTSNASLLPQNLQKLLSIGAENDQVANRGDRACASAGAVSNPVVTWGDTALSGSLCNGKFEILANNPYLANPGTLRLVAEHGLIVEKLVDGAFAPLASRLPNQGDAASFNLLFDTDFTGELDLDYDFSPIVTNPEVDAVFGFDGGGNAFAEVPGPLPWLGVGAGYGLSRNLRRRTKQRG